MCFKLDKLLYTETDERQKEETEKIPKRIIEIDKQTVIQRKYEKGHKERDKQKRRNKKLLLSDLPCHAP